MCIQYNYFLVIRNVPFVMYVQSFKPIHQGELGKLNISPFFARLLPIPMSLLMKDTQVFIRFIWLVEPLTSIPLPNSTRTSLLYIHYSQQNYMTIQQGRPRDECKYKTKHEKSIFCFVYASNEMFGFSEIKRNTRTVDKKGGCTPLIKEALILGCSRTQRKAVFILRNLALLDFSQPA